MIFKRIAAVLLWLLVTLTSAFGFMEFELKIASSDFFYETLDHVEQNDLGTRDTCWENGWLNYDTTSGYCVATNRGIPLSNNSARKLLQSRGASKQQARQVVASFDGQITATRGAAGDVFTITETATGKASGLYVTRGSEGVTPAARIQNLALPNSNKALVESQGILTRPQVLLEGRVGPQIGNPGFGPTATGGGHQVITDAFNGGLGRL
jgi:hypothetical protein